LARRTTRRDSVPAKEEREVGVPRVQGLSKTEANYRGASKPNIACGECKFMWPRLSIGGCRYVRGVIHAGDVCDLFAPVASKRG